MIVGKALLPTGTSVLVVGIAFAVLDRLRAGDRQDVDDETFGVALRLIAGRDNDVLLHMTHSVLGGLQPDIRTI